MFAPPSLDSYTNRLLALVDSINRANNHALLKSHVFVAFFHFFLSIFILVQHIMGDDPKCRGMRTLFFLVVPPKIIIILIIQGAADWIDAAASVNISPSNELAPLLSHFTDLSVKRGI